MRQRCCIRCDTPLETRDCTIDKRTFTAWVRVCGCESVTGSGWYFRGDNQPQPTPQDDDDIPPWS